MARKMDLRPLDSIVSPDQWSDIDRQRPKRMPFPSRRGRTRNRVATVALALLVATAGLVLLAIAFHDRPSAPVASDQPTMAPAPPSLIAFVTSNSRIAVVAPDGSDERVLTTGEEGGAAASVGSPHVADQSPQWSVDGKTIYFVRVVLDKTWLCTVRADGSGFNVITRHLDGGHIVLSPDGSRLAYDGNDGELHVIRNDGSPVDIRAARVASSGSFMWGPDRPAWSPDGTEIAFAGPADGTGRCGNDGCALLVLNLETGQLSNLTEDQPSQKVVSVVWAPDDQVIFSSVDLSSADSASPLKLWTTDRDGSVRRELPSDGRTIPVTYSPDGSALLVGRYGPFPHVDNRGLFIVDGSLVRPLVSDAVSAFGDWRA
jgi:Tol biopolymer transport system component